MEISIKLINWYLEEIKPPYATILLILHLLYEKGKIVCYEIYQKKQLLLTNSKSA